MNLYLSYSVLNKDFRKTNDLINQWKILFNVDPYKKLFLKLLRGPTKMCRKRRSSFTKLVKTFHHPTLNHIFNPEINSQPKEKRKTIVVRTKCFETM